MSLMSHKNPPCNSSGLFFYNRIPKLGSYMAVPLFLKNFLNTESFDSALESTKNYEEQLKQYQEEFENMKKENSAALAELDPETEEYK